MTLLSLCHIYGFTYIENIIVFINEFIDINGRHENTSPAKI